MAVKKEAKGKDSGGNEKSDSNSGSGSGSGSSSESDSDPTFIPDLEKDLTLSEEEDNVEALRKQALGELEEGMIFRLILA